MTNGPAIVIRGTREDWPGGPRTLRPLDPNREPNWQTFWFGAELDPGNEQVWFRITLEAVHRMQEETPGALGNRRLLCGVRGGGQFEQCPGPTGRALPETSWNGPRTALDDLRWL